MLRKGEKGGDVARYIGRYGSAKVNVPTLEIHASNDPVAPFETTGKLAHEMVADSALKDAQNGPRGFAMTHQDQLNNERLAFLQK